MSWTENRRICNKKRSSDCIILLFEGMQKIYSDKSFIAEFLIS